VQTGEPEAEWRVFLWSKGSWEEGVGGGLASPASTPPSPPPHTLDLVALSRAGRGEGGKEGAEMQPIHVPWCNTPHFPCWVKTKTLYNLFLELVSSCQEERVN
jgi:hypothetical protein